VARAQTHRKFFAELFFKKATSFFKGFSMKFHLVVLKPFAGFKRGDLITDQAMVEKVLAGPQAGSVVRIMAKEG